MGEQDGLRHPWAFYEEAMAHKALLNLETHHDIVMPSCVVHRGRVKHGNRRDVVLRNGVQTGRFTLYLTPITCLECPTLGTIVR